MSRKASPKPPCSQPGCSRSTHARALCAPHYLLWWRQKNPGHGRSYYLANREGLIEYQKAYNANTRHRRYGLSAEEYEGLIALQGSACGICGEPPVDGGTLFIDHDHKTGAPRGLLCSRCNTGLGFFSDDPDRLRSAASYVDSPPVSRVRLWRSVGDDER